MSNLRDPTHSHIGRSGHSAGPLGSANDQIQNIQFDTGASQPSGVTKLPRILVRAAAAASGP